MTSTAEVVNEQGTRRGELKHLVQLVEEWSTDHVAVLSADGRHLTFSRPGTGVYRVHFRIEGNYLLVWGDVGDAIYAWSSPITWEFLAKCDSEYFASKCRSHENGRFARGWSAEVAYVALRTHFSEDRTVSWASFKARLPEWGTRAAWMEWLRDTGEEVFGADHWEWTPRIGDVADMTMVAHWRMLQLAVAGMPEPAVAGVPG